MSGRAKKVGGVGCRSFKNVPTGAISADKMFQNATLFFSSLEVVFGPPFARVVFVTQKRVKQVKHFTVVAFSRQTHCYTQCYLHLSV